MSTAQSEAASEQVIRKLSTEEDIHHTQNLQYVVFSLAGEEYGIGILDVKEIVKTGQITTVPDMSDFISGVINLRGKIVVVIDLAKRLFLERTEADTTGQHIVIVLIKENMVGLLVDKVTEVLRLPENAIKSAPKLITEKMDSKYLTGVGTIDERLVILLDITKVLSEEELIKLSKTTGVRYQKIKSREVTELNSKKKRSPKVETAKEAM